MGVREGAGRGWGAGGGKGGGGSMGKVGGGGGVGAAIGRRSTHSAEAPPTPFPVSPVGTREQLEAVVTVSRSNQDLRNL